jgi:hypothetical protein
MKWKFPATRSHGKNLIGTSQIELDVKLLMLRAFDLLANDSSGPMPAYAIEQKNSCVHSSPSTRFGQIAWAAAAIICGLHAFRMRFSVLHQREALVGISESLEQPLLFRG